jgi:hypothetical protein
LEADAGKAGIGGGRLGDLAGSKGKVKSAAALGGVWYDCAP